MNKIYIKTKDNKEFYEYGYIHLAPIYNNNYTVTKFDISADFDRTKTLISQGVCETIASMTFASPPKGSKLKTKEGSPYAAADIRKNYNLVRKEEKADYIVFAKDKIIPDYLELSRKTVIFPKVKLVTLNDCYYSDKLSDEKCIKMTKKAISHIYTDDMLEDAVVYATRFTYLDDSYDDIVKACLGISGDVNKLAEYENLDMNSGEDVTLDSLKILKNALLNKRSSLDEENAIVAMMAFHNLNYRKVPGTIDRFFTIMSDNSYMLRAMASHPSMYSKPIRELLENYGDMSVEFADKDDYNLYYQFIETLMNVEDEKIVHHKDYDRKIAFSPVSEDMFNEIYDVVVRITPKKYEDYISAKQDGNTAC